MKKKQSSPPSHLIYKADEIVQIRQQVHAGHAKEAVDKLHDFLLKNKKDSYAWSTLAYAELVQLTPANFEKALSAINEALLIEPKHLPYLFTKAEILTNLKRHKEALPLLLMLNRTPVKDKQLIVWNRLCVAYFYLGQQAEAIKYGRQILLLQDKLSGSVMKKVQLKENKSESDQSQKQPAVIQYQGKINLFSSNSVQIKHKELKNKLSRQNKVIAYSLWGKAKPYLVGAMVNARLCQQLMPDWKCRFYVDSSIPQVIKSNLVHAGAEIIEGSEAQQIIPNYFWRFLVAADPTVDRFLCRDADSRLSQSEVQAIRQWELSGKAFHVIRDHVIHCELVLAGLWGGISFVNFDMVTAIKNFLDRYKSIVYGADQRFLRAVIWPNLKENCLIHDNYYDLFGAKKLPMHPAKGHHIGEGIVGEKALDSEVKHYQLPYFVK